MRKKLRVSVAGASGLVGREILRLLEERRFPVGSLCLLASPRSAGEEVFYGGKRHVIQETTREAFVQNTDLCLASAGKTVSGWLREWARDAGIKVIDNSSAFRMDPEVPLIVPEVNIQDIHKQATYIANPNCSTIQLVLPLKALHDSFGLKRVVVSTYQAVSGAGQKGVTELSEQSIALFNSKTEWANEVFPHRIAFNLIPQIGAFAESGFTEEELKVTNETRRILHLPQLPVACTAVRVPVFSAHSEAVMVELDASPELKDVREALAGFKGIELRDDPLERLYPMPMDSVEKPEVFVGRIRKDMSVPGCFHFWVVSDNLWKGAALNAVQIAEELVERQLI